MTDKKQIMIDGVDILDCDSYYVEQETDQVKCDLSSDYCRENKNCMFKQLARKTQELEVICKSFDIEYAYNDDGKIYGRSNKLRSLEQECKQKDERIIELTKEYQRIKEQKDKADKTISDLIGCVSSWEEFTEEESKLAKDSSIADLIMLLRKKTQECEELKKELNGSEKWRVKAESLNEKLSIEKDRYRKTLEEIEGYLKLPTNVCLTDCSEYSIGQSCSQNCFHNRLKLLLDIINKVKGGENEHN